MSDLEFTNLGAIESEPDYRDVPASAVASALPLPAVYSYKDMDKFPIWHQKKIGSCVGHALAKLMQVYWYQQTGEVVNFSPRWLYALAKCLDDYPFEGTYPPLMANIMKKYGCATEATVPNNSDLLHEEYVYGRKIDNLPKEAFDEAAKYKIPGYAFVDVKNPEDVKRALYEHGAMAALFRIGKEWWTSESGVSSWSSKDIDPLRPPAVIISGHEVILYGYNESSFYHLSNSWSSLWNTAGNGTIGITNYMPFFNSGIVIVNLPPPIKEEIERLPKKPQHTFSINLEYGMRNNPEVVALQDILKYEGLMPAHIPSTGNYLEETRKAVLAYQKKYKLITVYQELVYRGKYCYEITRKSLNSKYA